MISIRQVHPVFAGEVSGVDLRQPLSKADVAAIEAGMDRYAVLVFRDQNITDDQQMAFTKNFGEIENAKGGNITKDNEYRLKQGMVDVSNLDKDGKPLPRDDRRRMFNLGNRLWHSDSSFRAKPAKYSILSARTRRQPGRQHRVRRHARRLRHARRCDARGDRGSGVRALADLLARLDGVQRSDRGREGDDEAGAPAPGAHASGDRAQVALSLLACRPRSSAGWCRNRATSCAT